MMDEFSNISASLYEIQWQECTPKTRKLIIFAMMQAQKPVVLTFGKIFQIDLQFFNNVITTKPTSFTVLKIEIFAVFENVVFVLHATTKNTRAKVNSNFSIKSPPPSCARSHRYYTLQQLDDY